MSKSLTLAVDPAIPFAEPLFGSLGKLIHFDPENLSPGSIRKADALVVRSVTPVTPSLLERTLVQFVGTATIGTDHLDIAGLDSAAIQWSAAEGCNAMAVVQYVLSATSRWLERQERSLDDLVIGIVGVGEIGSRLQRVFDYLGATTVVCDPPKQEAGIINDSQSVTELFKRCDLVSFHTPLSYTGAHKTHQIIADAFAQLPTNFSAKGKLLINSARGMLADNASLKQWTDWGGQLALDVWPNEPAIETDWLDRVLTATSHIAGYSIEGKLNASFKIYQQLAAFFEQKAPINKASLIAPPIALDISQCVTLSSLFLASYDIRNDHRALIKNYLQEGPSGFVRLRNQYHFRRDFSGQDWSGNKSFEPLKCFLNGLT